MMHNTATIDIAPTPFQARVLSLPLEWTCCWTAGRGGGAPGGGKTYAVILEVFRRAEQWGAQSRTLITRRTQGALSELEHELLSIFRLRYGTGRPPQRQPSTCSGCPNGAYVELRNLESHKDLLPLQGKSFGLHRGGGGRAVCRPEHCSTSCAAACGLRLGCRAASS